MQTQKTQLEELYDLNRQHLSDLHFFDDESKFIGITLEKHFLPMLTDFNITRAQLIKMRLAELNMVKANVARDINIHQTHIESTIKDESGRSIDFLNLEGDRISDEIKELVKRFRNIKKEVYGIFKAIHPEEHTEAVASAI